MSILDRTDSAPERDETIDLTPTEVTDPDSASEPTSVRLHDDGTETSAPPDGDRNRHLHAVTVHDHRSGRPPVRGLRIRRIRLWSVAKIAAVFYLLGYLATMATLVVVWNLALHLGFISTIEDAIASSLGLDSYQVVGQVLFNLFLVGVGVLALLGLIVTVLLAVVYNASCALFGGVALETAPLRRPRRVFSLRHRRFVTVR